MLKITNESTEEEMIRQEEKELEGEFYYMSTRYKSLIPLINEVKAQRGEIQHFKSIIADMDTQIEKIIKWIKGNTNENNNGKNKK